MTVETFDIQQAAPSITATAAAVTHFQRWLAPKGLSAVRIHLEKSGCTGYKYVLDEVAAPSEGDLTVNLDSGLTLFLPPADLPLLNGMELDCVQEGVNFRLVINNPNAKEACGCGESFGF